MAIGIHIVKVHTPLVDGVAVQRVKEKATVSNSADDPTVDDFLEAEASDGYLPTSITAVRIVTVKVTDVNSA